MAWGLLALLCDKQVQPKMQSLPSRDYKLHPRSRNWAQIWMACPIAYQTSSQCPSLISTPYLHGRTKNTTKARGFNSHIIFSARHNCKILWWYTAYDAHNRENTWMNSSWCQPCMGRILILAPVTMAWLSWHSDNSNFNDSPDLGYWSMRTWLLGSN